MSHFITDPANCGCANMEPQGLKEQSIAETLSAKIASLTPAQRALLTLRLKNRRSSAKEAEAYRHVRVTPVPRNQTLPLSYAQQRFWFRDQISPGGSFYNCPAGLRLKGDLNIDVLYSSIGEVVQRHDILRTTFHAVEGQPVQVVQPSAQLDLPVIDFSHLSAVEREEKAEQEALDEALKPFDLASGPLLRCKVLRLDAQQHILLLVMHHIICDAWSMEILFKEMIVTYQASLGHLPCPLEDLPIQYVDYAWWQRQELDAPAMADHLAYWKKRLDGAPTMVELPIHSSHTETRHFTGERIWFHWPSELCAAIKQLTEVEGTTVFVSLMAGLAVLLGRYSGQNDLIIGTPVTNRPDIDLERLIGPFINLLIIRTYLSSNPTFRELISQVNETVLEAIAHQALPFERLVEELRPARSMNHAQLFQVMLRFEKSSVSSQEFQLPNLTLTPLDLHQGTDFDLTFSVEEHAGGFKGFVAYHPEVFEKSTVQKMLGHWMVLLESLTGTPDQPISMAQSMRGQERRQILQGWNQTQIDFGEKRLLHELIEEQVERTPQQSAAIFENSELSYFELNSRANCLAHRLMAAGVGTECIVGLCLPRSLELMVALVAVLKSGGAYLPLDPELPPERLRFMVSDTDVRVVLTVSEFREIAPAAECVIYLDEDWAEIGNTPADNLKLKTPPDMAYVIFTSGSTGEPKAAINTHAGITNRLLWMQSAYGLTMADRVLQKTPFTFDVSVWEFFWPLMTGASVVLARPGGHRDVQYLADLIADQRISVMHFSPSLLELFLQAEGLDRCQWLRHVVCSGEALSHELEERFFQRMGARLHNLYGPTEAAVDVTAWECQRNTHDAMVPLGRPIANTQIYILNAELEPLPIHAPGELHIGGHAVGRGYLNRPALTAQKFIPDPFSSMPGCRLYKTGDLARYRADGTIEFLGRLDHQVKIRGVRIELGEIESALEKHPGVRRAVVIDHNHALVAYIVSNTEVCPDWVELRGFLRQRLPGYMQPAAFMHLDELPLTTSGKLNRRALAVPEISAPAVESIAVAPRDELELQLARIWEQVMGRWVGVKDDFFRMGGHSMLAVQLLSKIQKQFGQNVSLAAFFSGPTIESTASLLRRQSSSFSSRSLVAIQPSGTRLPIFAVHPASGHVFCYYELARQLGDNQPFYGLQSAGLDGVQEPFSQIEAMAAHYIAEMRTLHSNGPFQICGWSLGGVVAFEMAQQLQRQGEAVTMLALLDAGATGFQSAPLIEDDGTILADIFNDVGIEVSVDELQQLNTENRFNLALALAKKSAWVPVYTELPEFLRYFEIYKRNIQAFRNYVPHTYPGKVSLFRCTERKPAAGDDPAAGWRKLAQDGTNVIDVHCTHHNILSHPNVGIVAEGIKMNLERT